MPPVPPAAASLFALPPSRFVAERDALARALSEKGDAAAAAVRALRRPVGLAWVMNRLARERPGEVGALLDAADRLGRGQRRALAGHGAEELRAAEAELRGRARALRDAAAPLLADKGSPQALSRLELLFRLAAASPGAREALRAGTLEREPQAQPMDLSGLAVVEGGPPPRRAGRAARRARGDGDGDGSHPKERARARSDGGAAAEADRRERAREEAAARAREAALRRARAAGARSASAARRAEAAAQRAEDAAARAAERARALRRRAESARADADARARAADALSAQAGAPRPTA